MKPFEPLKFGKSLTELNARIQTEGSKAVLSPVIEKFILKNPHKVVVAMRVINQIILGQTLWPCLLLLTYDFFCSLIHKRFLLMKKLRKKY